MRKLWECFVWSACGSLVGLGGCGAFAGVQNGASVGANRVTLRPFTPVKATDRDRSWMLPEAEHENLLYASITSCNGTCVYSYPRGKLVGTISVSSEGGLCADHQGDVYIPSYLEGSGPVVYEFAHGGTHPIAVLDVPGETAGSCSVDSTTGNLAVTFLCRRSSCEEESGVAVYANARGVPTLYEIPNFEILLYCGYDNAGNLFADGTGGTQHLDFFELPYDGSSLEDLSIDQSVGDPGQVQWDGSHITIQDAAAPGSIYQLEVSGSAASVIGTTQLGGITGFSGQSWIQRNTVIVGSKPRGQHSNIRFWRYPAGGKAYKLIRGYPGGAMVLGLTVSLAKR